LAAALTEQPETGDVMAFITETDNNDQTVGETVLQTTLREHYDMVAYLAGERFGVVIGDLDHSRRGSLAPCVRTGDYASYLDACVLPYARGEEDARALLSLSAVEAHLKDDPVWEVNLPFELDGETFFKRFAFYEMDRRAHFYILLLDDTTEVHREQTLRNRRLAEALQEANRANEAKTVFFSNMSHDIRTPMNAIIGFADLARRSDDPELVRQYLDKIAASGDHLLALINDVLEMSRIESGKMQLEPTATDLVSAMEQVHDLFVGQMSAKGIGFTVETSVTDRWVLCDKTRLDRVLLNLISNAGKFTPEGGSVAVTLDQTGASGADRSYRIRVCDTGVGMSEEFAQKVFNAFERASTADSSGVQGTGLGMAITKSIIEMMHGTISVDTAPGKGTTFTVDLTLTVAQEPVVRGVSAGLCGSMDCSKLRLLLVEDNEINREIATFLLREQGFRLDTAVNGREAVDMVAAAPGAYDAVLMDVQMPVMNGYDATHAIRALDDPAAAGVPIIAMTANAFQEDVRDALEAGMDAHIAKPFDFERIMETLSGVLSKKRS